jgi:hypothetical protein
MPPAGGTTVCQSGAYSATENCGGVFAIDQCYTYTGLQQDGFVNDSTTVCGLVFANAQSTSGDSGSPVYEAPNSSAAQADGLLSGGGTDSNGNPAMDYVFIVTALSGLGSYAIDL